MSHAEIGCILAVLLAGIAITLVPLLNAKRKPERRFVLWMSLVLWGYCITYVALRIKYPDSQIVLYIYFISLPVLINAYNKKAAALRKTGTRKLRRKHLPSPS